MTELGCVHDRVQLLVITRRCGEAVLNQAHKQQNRTFASMHPRWTAVQLLHHHTAQALCHVVPVIGKYYLFVVVQLKREYPLLWQARRVDNSWPWEDRAPTSIADKHMHAIAVMYFMLDPCNPDHDSGTQGNPVLRSVSTRSPKHVLWQPELDAHSLCEPPARRHQQQQGQQTHQQLWSHGSCSTVAAAAATPATGTAAQQL